MAFTAKIYGGGGGGDVGGGGQCAVVLQFHIII